MRDRIRFKVLKTPEETIKEAMAEEFTNREVNSKSTKAVKNIQERYNLRSEQGKYERAVEKATEMKGTTENNKRGGNGLRNNYQ